ncbi:tetratricopeptide repeat protein [Streptomyces sp. NPDC015414]|uniref:caspase, EACC1-associated type n=1 Tax=Streptomyces sp. NPDC015414 TaxID=3364957 RepID=UPI0036FCE467
MTGEQGLASRAVLLGVDTYDHFNDLGGVRNNVPALRAQLIDPAVGGMVDENCVSLPADSSQGAVLDAVQLAAEEASDLLLVYYAGHGHFHRDGESLLLSTRASHHNSPHRSVPYAEIRAYVTASQARRKVVIIDSCFSGGALHMDGSSDGASKDSLIQQAERLAIDGACVLTSAAETQRSLCTPEGSVFTLELVKLLRHGLTGPLPHGRRGEDQSHLTTADVYEALRQRLRDRKVDGWDVPQPHMATRDGGHSIRLARNRACREAPAEAPGQARGPRTAFAPSRHFTGREEEISELVRWANSPPAICLIHGRSGQGKSELLRAAAARIAHLFPAGCIEVDLRGWTPGAQPRDAYEVIGEQLQHIGYESERIPKDSTARTEAWRLLLTNHRLLLILDNARNASQLRPLLPGGGSQSVLFVSSRNALPDLAADWSHALAPLPESDCIAVWHKMGIAETTLHLGELAARIHGSPYALGVLATALKRGASPRSLLASLSEPRPFRLHPELDAVEQAAFTSAYDALDSELRALVQHCAWHPGPDFGPDSIAAMAGRPEAEVDIQLTRIEQLLIGKHGRYTFHELSRIYARRAGEESGAATARRSRERLFEHLMSNLADRSRLLREGTGGLEREPEAARRWLDHHALELSTVAQAALEDQWRNAPDFLLELALWHYHAGRYTTSEEISALLLANVGPASPVRADVLRNLGDVHRAQGHYDEAASAYHDALTVVRELGDQSRRAAATSGLGDVAYARGDYDGAASAYQKALALYMELDSDRGKAKAISGMGDVHYAQGRYEEAGEAHRSALLLYQKTNDMRGQADAISGLANLHYAQDRYPQATALHEEALAVYEGLGNGRGQANAHKSLGDIHYVEGRFPEARAAYTEALDVYERLGDRHGKANALSGLAEVHYAQGEYGQAAETHQEAFDLYEWLGDRHGLASALGALADVCSAQGQYDRAVETYNRARVACAELGDKRGLADADRGLGAVHHVQGEYAGAAESFQEALSVYQDLGDRRGQAGVLRDLAHTALLLGRPGEAIDRASLARTLFAELGRFDRADVMDRFLNELAS